MRKIFRNARALRSGLTDAEATLWRKLRGRQIAGCKFRRQFPIAGFIADFACVEAGLVIELDGGQHVDRANYDTDRTRRLSAQGYRVLRYWNDDVLKRTDDVLEDILRHISTPNTPLDGAR